jgi:hypothetical protein
MSSSSDKDAENFCAGCGYDCDKHRPVPIQPAFTPEQEAEVMRLMRENWAQRDQTMLLKATQQSHDLVEARKLWAHCVSEHAAILRPDETLEELTEFHEHEHDGPGTIRNHPRDARNYTLRKIGKVLSEAED